MIEVEPLEDLFSRFLQICHRFCEGKKPFGKELFEWYLLLLSLFIEKY